jgi:hypothetical protein
MITILILSIILVTVAAVLLFQARNLFDQKAKEMELANKLHSAVRYDLEGAHLEYRLLNSKLSNELKYWKFRRKIFEDPSTLRKKKIRGKKRKGRNEQR